MAKSNAVQPGAPMSQDELLGLQNAVANVSLQDVQVGRVLDAIVSHLARLNNLDYPVQPDPEAAPSEQEQVPAQEGA